MEKKITAIIPTLNEEIHIENAIRSVDFADEIIVIDSFSEDNTVTLAKKHNVNLVQRKFDDFSTQKNYAIQLAKYNWIYILDADERVTLKLKKEILDAVHRPEGLVGFFIYRNFYFFKKKIKYGGWQRDKVIRLFRKDKCKYNGLLVHELIEYNGKIGYLKNKIEHYSYRNYDQYVAKLNHYASLQAKQLFENKQSVHVFHLVIVPLYRFFVHYIIRFGFLDGFPGFVLGTQHSFGVLTRYIKLRLLYMEKSKK